jgi:hypothetical protein
VIGLWLVAWTTDTVVLVQPSVQRLAYDSNVGVYHFFIGVSIERSQRGEAWRYGRRPLSARIQ